MEFATTTEVVNALQTRRVSAVELLTQCIARIDKHDAAINAVVVRDFERARVAAANADAAIARGERRPLLGVPMTVKEAIHVAGLPTTWGIPGTQAIPVTTTAVAVRRLERAGAVIVGKTNVATQLGDWQTFNPVYGTTNNPWDVARTPGGSSGGGAAALAAGFVSLELGSDLNGSLRIPAHCCGVLAHKPTFGLVPTRGFAPPGVPVLSVNKDVDFAVLGPMARSAADLALALDIVAGPDEADAIAYRLSLPAARHERLKDFRVLVIDEHPQVTLSSEVRAVLQNVAEGLERSGCRVARGSALLPDLEATSRAFVHLLMAFFGSDMPDANYEDIKSALAHLPPTNPAAAEMRGLVSSHRDWIGMDRARLGIVHQWRALFREWDVVVCPVLPTPAFAHDHGDINQRTIDVDGTRVPYKTQPIWMSVASLAGLPATAIPAGRGSVTGLPIGIQAIAPHLEDRTGIAFAQLFEREFGGYVAPPGFAV
jgi:amidase